MNDNNVKEVKEVKETDKLSKVFEKVGACILVLVIVLFFYSKFQIPDKSLIDVYNDLSNHFVDDYGADNTRWEVFSDYGKPPVSYFGTMTLNDNGKNYKAKVYTAVFNCSYIKDDAVIWEHREYTIVYTRKKTWFTCSEVSTL